MSPTPSTWTAALRVPPAAATTSSTSSGPGHDDTALVVATVPADGRDHLGGHPEPTGSYGSGPTDHLRPRDRPELLGRPAARTRRRLPAGDLPRVPGDPAGVAAVLVTARSHRP